MVMNKKEKVQIYWERQGNDRLCGLHCVNSLLQGPYYDEISLSQIGIELDKKEQALYGTSQQLQNNVDDKGSFSVQAIKITMGVTLEAVDSEINKLLDLTQENGFVCNSVDHWFSIRKIGKTFYNLNSIKPVPLKISDFYLSAFLQGVKQDGYSIFVARGNFKFAPNHIFENLQDHQYLFTPGQIESIKNREQTPDKGEDIKEEEEKVQAFSGKGVQLVDQQQQIQNKANYQFQNIDPNIDPEYAMVLKLSLQEKYAIKPEKGLLMKFVNPDGKKYDWKFELTQLISDLYDFAKFNMPDNEKYQFYISQNFPQRVYNDVSKTLKEAGINQSTVFYVNKI